LAGTPLAVRKHALVARALALKYGAQDPLLLHGETMQDIWTNLEDLAGTTDLLPTEAVLKVAALPSEIGTVIDVARDTCMEHEIRLCWSADAAAGIGWLRIVRDDGDEEHFSAALRALQVVLARRWRNAIVVGCSSALRRHLPLWGADPQGLELMRAIKNQFDPAGILNPGRFG
jgi:glycolate oxidase FAD binding subunit